MMDLRQLRYFVAVAEEGNFIGGAMKANVTQPPVTRQIRALEQDLGVQLFHRTPRGTILTQAGLALLDDARQMLSLSRRARERANAAARGEAGRLAVAFFGSPIYRTVPALLRSFKAQVPGVELSLVAMPKDRQIEALRMRSIEVGFSRNFPSAPDIENHAIFPEHLLVALRLEDTLAGSPSLKLAQLAGRPLVLFPTGGRPSFADKVVALMGGTGLTPTVGAEADDAASALAMVAIGCGVSLVPESVTSIQVPGVTFVHLNEAELYSPTECIHLRSNPAPIVAKFIRVVRDEQVSFDAGRLPWDRG